MERNNPAWPCARIGTWRLDPMYKKLFRKDKDKEVFNLKSEALNLKS
jgi:hypothetical protein